MDSSSLTQPAPAARRPTPFSTDVFGHWGQTVSQKILPLVAHNAQPSEHFQGRATIARFHDSVVADIHASAHRVMRTRGLVSQDRQRYFKVLWQLSGSNQLDQKDGSATIHAGQWAIYDTSRPYTIETSDDSHFLMLLLPLDEIGQWGTGIERITAKALPAQGTAEVARAALRSLLDGEVELGREGQMVLQDSILALMGAAIRQVDAASEGEQRAAHRKLQMAKAYIERNLTAPVLNADAVAQACGMSRRSLYTAFNTLNLTPHAYIMRCRLALASELLSAPDGKRTITQVAYELGFSDAAHFSRAFSERFGMSPSQWRTRQTTCS